MTSRLRLVLTWGEALQARTALLWACRVRLIDLLISTECWLSLFAVRPLEGIDSGVMHESSRNDLKRKMVSLKRRSCGALAS